MDSLRKPRNITSLDGSYYQTTASSISQNIFSYLKIFSMKCRRSITAEAMLYAVIIINYTFRKIDIFLLCLLCKMMFLER